MASIRKRQIARLKQENKKHTKELKLVPKELWPKNFPHGKPVLVWRSCDYFVQLYKEDHGERLSVNRCVLQGDSWAADIKWEELMDIKRKTGYADRCCFEVYPREANTVNVANMRHLWILPAGEDIGWVKDVSESVEGK